MTMNNTWYQRSMPTIKDVKPHVEHIANSIKAMPGVQSVCIHGSYASHLDCPNFVVNDLDFIAVTEFDAGDLMAIDAGKDSPLKMASSEWEDYGFNPKAVIFTKQFLGLKQYAVDLWVTANNNKLLHWGAMPDTLEEWQDNKAQAEKYAQQMTGYNRTRLTKTNSDVKANWQQAYMHSLSLGLSKSQKKLGWCPSEHSAADVIASALKLV